MKLFLGLTVAFAFAGCASGTLQTPYGTLSSDGKSVKIILRAGS